MIRTDADDPSRDVTRRRVESGRSLSSHDLAQNCRNRVANPLRRRRLQLAPYAPHTNHCSHWHQHLTGVGGAQ